MNVNIDINPFRAKWTADQLAYDENLRAGPTAALEHFRAIYSARSLGSITQTDSILQISDVLTDYLGLCESTDDIWRACIDNAFVLFLLDIMAEPEFLGHYARFSTNILLQVPLLVGKLDQFTRDSPPNHPKLLRLRQSARIEALWTKAERVWASQWDRRERLPRDGSPDKDRLLEQLEFTASSILNLRKILVPESRSSKWMAMFSCVWAHLYGAPARDMSTLLSDHDALIILDENIISCNDTAASLTFMEELVRAVGIDQSFRAAQNALMCSPRLINAPLYACLKLLTFQYQAIGLDCYSTYPILPSISSALCRHLKQVGSIAEARLFVNTRLYIASGAFQHFGFILGGMQARLIQETAMSKTSASALWTILLYGFSFAVHADKALARTEGIADRQQAKQDIARFFGVTIGQIDLLAETVRSNRQPHAVIDRLRAQATSHTHGFGTWYSLIPDIQTANRESTSPNTFTPLLEAWCRLGAALGISEEAERRHFVDYRARFCWWRECQFYNTSCPTQPSVCKGCQENRYCSKTCQVKDWKKGSHRVQCRRLENDG